MILCVSYVVLLYVYCLWDNFVIFEQLLNLIISNSSICMAIHKHLCSFYYSTDVVVELMVFGVATYFSCIIL